MFYESFKLIIFQKQKFQMPITKQYQSYNRIHRTDFNFALVIKHTGYSAKKCKDCDITTFRKILP